MIGYANDHTEGTFRLMNCQTKEILLFQDVIWSKYYYGEYENKYDLLIENLLKVLLQQFNKNRCRIKRGSTI